MFVKTIDLTEEQRHQVSEMCAKLILWILEARSVDYMAKQLKVPKEYVYHNIDELLYTLRKHVGIRRFLRVLFWK